jgi:hypothetical protein
MSESSDYLRAIMTVTNRATRRASRKCCMAARAGLIVLAGVVCLNGAPASADKLKHPVAVFSGLDKITGRIITFEVAINETVQFGSLQITERVCYSRPLTEAPQTDTFVEVENIDANNDYKRIFSGWMFAGSPSLHALDHPVYDIWLLRCKGTGELIPEAASTQSQTPEVVPPLEPVKPAVPKPKRTPAAAADVQRPPPLAGGPIEVAPPPGFVPPSEQRTPTRRFYPTTPAQDGQQ